MKKTILMACVVASMFACNSAPKSDKAEVGDAKEVKEDVKEDAAAKEVAVDLGNSEVTWVGSEPVKKHNGTIGIKEGNLSIKDNKIVAGKFLMDLNTIKVLDIKEDNPMNAKLKKHLLNEDFFDAGKFPNVTFEFVSMEDYTPSEEEQKEQKDAEYSIADPTHKITGNLEIKGKKKSITFPAKVSIEGDKVSAEAKFNIDRTLWDMNYKYDKSLGDEMINKEINIGINLKTQ